MNESRTLKLTWEMIHQAGTNHCGWNKLQFAALDIPYPPRKGWLSQLIGRVVPVETWAYVVSVKGSKNMKAAKRIIREQQAEREAMEHFAS